MPVWLGAVVAARAYRAYSFIMQGCKTNNYSIPLSSVLLRSNRAVFHWKRLSGLRAENLNQQCIRGSSRPTLILSGYLVDSPPLCTQYNTFSRSYSLCDRACSFCVGSNSTQCTGGCGLSFPPIDPTALYPWGTCPSWTCDGQCGGTQNSCSDRKSVV